MTCMYLTIFEEVDHSGLEGGAIDAASLYREFEKVKDGRGAKGKRYPLPLLLTLFLQGKLAGETSINGVVDWIKERQEWLKRQLDWPKRFPVKSTCSEALALCDGQQIAQAMAQMILKARAVEPEASEQEQLVHSAMDGKVMRGTLGHDKEGQPPVHRLSLYECESGLVIAQQAVKSKENEISAASALLQPVLVKGRISSADAMHTQKAWCAAVEAYGGYYLLEARENQTTVRQDILDFFADKALEQEEWQYHKTVQKGHGRLEVREIWTSTQMNAWFEPDWAGISQIFLIRRLVTSQGGADRYWVLGDFAAIGYDPVSPLEKLTALPHASFTSGNTDRYVVTEDLPVPPGQALQDPAVLLDADEHGYRIQLRRVDYDREVVIKAIEHSRHPTPSYLIGFMRGEHISETDPGF